MPGTILNVKYGQSVLDRNIYSINDHYWSQYVKEVLFEEVRKTNFPFLPSRLNSIYLVDSLEMAEEFKSKQNRKFIYRVTVDTSKEILRADMKLLDMSNRQSIEIVKQLAYNYFSGGSTTKPFYECLIEGQVVIKDKIE